MCLNLRGPLPVYWYSPEPQLLEELQTSAHRVVAPAQCPQTFDVMVSVYIDNHNPARPPGYIDPHDLDVDPGLLLATDSASFHVTSHQGTFKQHFLCTVRRDERRTWRARCEYLGRSLS